MASYHATKFGGQRHCGSAGIFFLVAEEQDYTCLLKSAIAAYL